jgi:hypothetical protein
VPGSRNEIALAHACVRRDWLDQRLGRKIQRYPPPDGVIMITATERRPRVLCVDDDAFMLNVLMRTIGADYEVLTSMGRSHYSADSWRWLAARVAGFKCQQQLGVLLAHSGLTA